MRLLEYTEELEVQSRPCKPPLAYRFNPLKDCRWGEFVLKHPRASLFHCTAWLEALWHSYGYEPIAYTTSEPGKALSNAIVFCRVESWLTGRRLVSLPFSDHCEPLVDAAEDRAILVKALQRDLAQEKWDYLEIRPLGRFRLDTPFCRRPITYAFHQLDLESDIQTIFSNFHKSSTQRKIRRAQREGLVYREGSTKELLDDFYRLFILTRKHHGLAPQPTYWFASLMYHFEDALKIRVALKGDQAIAAMITIRHKDTLTYKYGCSDPRFNNLGPVHMLFWHAIQEAKASGLRWLDFGRTNADQDGLITFKNRWGAAQSVLTYSRYGSAEKSTHLCDLYLSKRKSWAANAVLRSASPLILPMIGQAIYKHIG